MPPTPTQGASQLTCVKLDSTLRPVCSPISNLEDVLAADAEREKQWLHCGRPLSKRWAKEAGCTRSILVCHDMKGGYLEDRYLQGADVMESYRFWHWHHADTWIYFSHKFVTIPPPSWIAAAHRHGVKVLGTVITEHEEGSYICCDFLRSEETYKRFADKLVALAAALGFEGWLINIENKIELGLMSNLQGFLKYLFTASHSVNAESLVLWYDSVITSGELKWQDELNELNRPFFEVCDGLFTNYCWNKEKLIKTQEEEKKADRCGQVLIGVDVFGRGCIGGGGYNTKEALSMIKEHNLSVALFAPGWVYEVEGKEKFSANNNRFWSEVNDLLPRRNLTQLPLVSSFCQGFGAAFYRNGEKILDKAWSDLGLQQLQPNFSGSLKAARGSQLNAYPSDDETCGDRVIKEMPPLPASLFTEDAFLGGGCLMLDANLAVSCNYCPLFKTELKVTCDLLLIVTFKLLDPVPCSVTVSLVLSQGARKTTLRTPYMSTGSRLAAPVSGREAHLKRMEDAEVLPYLPFKLESKNEWQTWYFRGDSELFKDSTVTEVYVGVHSKAMVGKTRVLLGRIILQEAALNVDVSMDFPKPDGVSLQARQVKELGLQVESESEGANKDSLVHCVQWQSSRNVDVDYYCIYVKQRGSVTCVGHTINTWFIIPRECQGMLSKAQVIIQPVLSSGFPVPLDRCTHLKVNSPS